jgi:hypothetical protein
MASARVVGCSKDRTMIARLGALVVALAFPLAVAGCDKKEDKAEAKKDDGKKTDAKADAKADGGEKKEKGGW